MTSHRHGRVTTPGAWWGNGAQAWGSDGVYQSWNSPILVRLVSHLYWGCLRLAVSGRIPDALFQTSGIKARDAQARPHPLPMKPERRKEDIPRALPPHGSPSLGPNLHRRWGAGSLPCSPTKCWIFS